MEAAYLEGRATLDMVVAAVSHDLVHTLNFLRCLAEDAQEPQVLSQEDLSIAGKEISRVQSILRHLRRLKLSPPVREPVALHPMLRLAFSTLANHIQKQDLSISIIGAEHALLATEAHLFYILVRNVLAAVVRSALPHSAVEVRVILPCPGSDGAVEAWGTTDLAPSAEDRNPFEPWIAEANGSNLNGIPVAYRIARLFGWTLCLQQETNRSGLRIGIPESAFLSGPA